MEASDGAVVGGAFPGAKDARGLKEQRVDRASVSGSRPSSEPTPGTEGGGAEAGRSNTARDAHGQGGSDSTIVVTADSMESSRLAHRFAPIPDPTLVGLFPDPGFRYDLEQDTTTVIGRDPKRCDLILVSPSVSSRHCQIVVDDDECSLTDLGSSNGTFVNGERLSGPRLLRQGDLITIGRYVFIFVWFRFARQPRPEVLCYRDVKALFSRLYPTASSVERILLAANLRRESLGPSEASSEQIWDELVEQFRRQDVVHKLGLLVRVALRDNPGNRDLERIKTVLENWTSARKEPGLQERINTDARNSARVVREILVTHLESDGETDSISQMLDEVTEELPPATEPGDDGLLHGEDSLPPPAADLPFEVPHDSIMPGPQAAGEGTQGPHREDPDGAAPDTGGDSPWTVAQTVEFDAEPLGALEPLDDGAGSVPAEEPGPGRGASVRTPRPDSDGAARTGAPPEDARAAAGVVTVAHEQEAAVIAGNLADLPEAHEPAPVEGEPVFKQPGSRRKYVVAGVGLAAAVALAIGLVSVERQGGGPNPGGGGPGGAPAVPVAAIQPGAGPANPAQPPAPAAGPVVSPGPVSETGQKPDRAETPAGDDGAPVKAGATGTGKTAVAVHSPAVPDGTVPVVPQFRVINFLDDRGEPAYNAADLAGTSAWDPDTSQIVGSALSDCRWKDGRTKRFSSKRSRLFLYIQCKADGRPVEGWVYHRAMKRR